MSRVGRSEPEQLLSLARAGDREALGQLFECYRRYLKLLAQLQIHEQIQAKIDASDCVQETFLKAYQGFAEFRGTTEGELMSWLRQILARNLSDRVHRYYGAQRRDVQLERSLLEELNRSSEAMDRRLVLAQSTPSQSAARRQQAVILADALDQLPKDYREVLILRHLKGLKFPEIARCMKRSEGSVQKLWVRALSQLRRSVGDNS